MVERVTFTAPETGPEAPPQATPPANRPDWMPEGFTGDEKALAKSWADQRAEVTRLQQELAKTKKGEAPAEQQPQPQVSAQKPEVTPEEQKPEEKTEEQKAEEAAKALAEQSGADFTPYQQEFATTGDVTAEGRDKIAEAIKKALPADLQDQARALVDQYVEGRKLAVANDRAMFMDAAGGEDNYKTMITWAKDNLPPDQIDAYNRAVNSDRSAALFAIEGLRSKFEKAEGRVGQRITAGSAPHSTGPSPFKSSAEMTNAMRDPRYKTDPAYRDEVKARLALSQF